MTIGFIGLGKMGSNMSKRLAAAGHEVAAYDPSESARQVMDGSGVVTVDSRDALLDKLDRQLLWMMIPSQFVDEELDVLLEAVKPGAVIVDGGNSDYRLSIERAYRAAKADVVYLDVGTSGGILGPEHGYSLMIGGDEQAVTELTPIFNDLSPTDGWHHFGQSGSGHFVKMTHNAIEYGLMQSYGEGYRLLRDGPFEDLDLAAAGNVWQHGSIIKSLLNQLAAEALSDNPTLDGVDGEVAESGETRWALEVAAEHELNLPAIQAAFDTRLASQNGQINFATKLVAALRNKFGGHDINEGSNQ